MSYPRQPTAPLGGEPYRSGPFVGPRAKIQYTIRTVTGDLPGAGTTAGVHPRPTPWHSGPAAAAAPHPPP